MSILPFHLILMKRKKEANIKEIKKRLKARSFHESFKVFYGYDKQVRTWGDATLASCVYLAEGPQEPDNILKQFVTLKGSKYWIALLYMTLYYGLILVGMFLSARFAVKRKSDAKAVDMPIFAFKYYDAWNSIVSDYLGM